MTASPTPDDVIDRLASPADPTLAYAIRQHRPKIAASIQATYAAIFVAETGAFDLALRLSCAAEVARCSGAAMLAEFYLHELQGLVQPARNADAQQLAEAAQQYAARAAQASDAGDQAALERLRAAGMSDYDLVTLGQLIGYVAFQARVLLATRALVGGAEQPATLAAPDTFKRHSGFTAESLEWRSWLTPLELAAATPEQLAVLDESGPTARTSPYYRTLVHNPEVLRQRSATYNAIMYAPGGLSRAERELAALVVSSVNGCPYCASVHAQRLNQLTKHSDLVERVFADPFTEGNTERERAQFRYARQLTLQSAHFGRAEVARLQALGMSDGEILDFSQVVAIFAWANRLMQGLGEPVWPAALPDANGGQHA